MHSLYHNPERPSSRLSGHEVLPPFPRVLFDSAEKKYFISFFRKYHRSPSPTKQDFLLDGVHYSNNKRNINLIQDRVERFHSNPVREFPALNSSNVSSEVIL